jgi:type II secretory pathway component PulF
VLPRFGELLADTGQALPAATRLVLAVGTAAHVALVPGLCAAAAAMAMWRSWVSREEGRKRWHGLLLAAPVLGPIRAACASGNACSALAALLDAGVPLATALPYAARASGDSQVESRLLAVRNRIAAGASLSSALTVERALTSTAVRLVRLGEETGRLSHMLSHAGGLESRRGLQRIQRTIRIIEPAFILAFGSVVMIVAAALLQAMYGLRVRG